MAEKIIFAGTPDFAAVHLQALLDKGFNIVAVYTQPDRPAGRGHKLTPSPVKELALKHNLPVYTPLNFKEEEDKAQWEAIGADIAIVVAYGVILPERVLNAPRLGCINVHGSLLPEWRGAAPIQRALLSGKGTTGVTIMQIVKALDAGDMLFKKEMPILDSDTSGSLFERMATVGAEALVEALPDILTSKITPEPQDEKLVTYAAKLSKEESPLNFNKSAQELCLQVRGLNPWPVATTSLGDTLFKVFEAHVLADGEIGALGDTSNLGAGAIVEVNASGIVVKCAEGFLVLKTIQAPGKGRVSAADLARSRKEQFARGVCFA